MQIVLALRRRHTDSYRFFLYTRRAIAWPIRKMVGVMHHLLTGWMLIGIEVAIEYMLGLTLLTSGEPNCYSFNLQGWQELVKIPFANLVSPAECASLEIA